MKGIRKVFRKLAAGFLAAALLAGPALAANPDIRIGSYKGNVLEVGERSGLIIGSGGTTCRVASSDPDVVAVEQVLSFWVAVAKAEGKAELTVTNDSGNTGKLTLTVGPAKVPEAIDLNANMEIRLKMAEYINAVRRENGRPELPLNEALMNTAQDVSSQCVMEHRPYDHKALVRYGWPHGGMFNLSVFAAYDGSDIARWAVTSWVNSPGHFQTMLMEEPTCLGAGVTIKDGRAYCYMVVGDPKAYNAYA